MSEQEIAREIRESGRQQLDALRQQSEGFFTRRLVLWGIRWSIGAVLIWAVVAYEPAWNWLWWVGAAIAALSLTTILVGRMLLNRKFVQTATIAEALAYDQPANAEQAHLPDGPETNQKSPLAAEINDQISDLTRSNPDILSYKNSIIRKWRKKNIFDVFDDQDVTPNKIAFLYLLLEKYDDLLKQEIEPKIKQSLETDFPDWEYKDDIDIAREITVETIDLDDLERGEWRLVFGNDHDLTTIHVYFNGWDLEHIGYTT